MELWSISGWRADSKNDIIYLSGWGILFFNLLRMLVWIWFLNLGTAGINGVPRVSALVFLDFILFKLLQKLVSDGDNSLHWSQAILTLSFGRILEILCLLIVRILRVRGRWLVSVLIRILHWKLSKADVYYLGVVKGWLAVAKSRTIAWLRLIGWWVEAFLVLNIAFYLRRGRAPICWFL